MTKNSLDGLDVCDLVYEMVRHGKGGELEGLGIDLSMVVSELEARTGKNYGQNVKEWCDWFCSPSSGFSDIERAMIKDTMEWVEKEDAWLDKLGESRRDL